MHEGDSRELAAGGGPGRGVPDGRRIQLDMTPVAACYGKSGGWIGQGTEVVRFLVWFAIWRAGDAWTAIEFARAWPHHIGGSWFHFAHGWN